MKVIFLFFFIIAAVSVHAVDLGTIGNVYDVKEKDFLKEVEERASTVDWGSMIDAAGKKIKANAGKVDMSFPKAADNATYYIDLTTKLDYPVYVRDKAGKPQVLYPKGYKFNVLDYVKLKQRYVIFDAERPEEVAWYKSIFADDPNTMPIISRGSALDFAKEVKREIYILDSRLADRFKLKFTPTVIYQLGNKLRADEFRLEEVQQ